MKLIMENWRSFLTERDPTPEEWEAAERGDLKPSMSKQEAAYWGPAFVELMENPETINRGKPWVEENIGSHLGSGVFRSVFEIRDHPDKVFKVGIWGRSKMMNYVEKTSFSQNAKWFPKVYLTSEDSEGQTDWLVLEKIQVVDADGEYQQLLLKNFPALGEALDLIFEKFGPYVEKYPGGYEMNRFKALIHPRKLFDVMIEDRKVNKRFEAIHRVIRNLLKRYDEHVPEGDEIIEEITRGVFQILNNSNIVILQELLDDVGFIQRWDIRTANVGRRGDQLVLIDIYSNDEVSGKAHPRGPQSTTQMYENKKHIKVFIK